MEFSVKNFDLLQELSLTQGVVERKTTIPILGNILCEAAGNKVTLTATDLELSIRTACEAKVKKEGSGTIPAKKLLELVRLLPEGEIRFKLLENHWVQILADRKTYKMVGMAKDNFPAIPVFPHPLVTIPAKILSSLIAKTAFAISNEESRYTLNGALLLLKPDTITMVATDGHRLAVAETDYKFAGLTREVRPLVPKKALTEVQRLASEAGEDGQIEFALDDSHLFFRVGERLLISRMLTGQFPNYEAVMPRDNTKFVVVRSVELSAAIGRVAQFADERSGAVRIKLEQNEVKITAQSNESGESEDTIETPYTSDPLVVGFNSSYMLDFLKAIGNEGEVRLEFKDGQSAGQMRPETAPDDPGGEYRYRYVLMPMRI